VSVSKKTSIFLSPFDYKSPYGY